MLDMGRFPCYIYPMLTSELEKLNLTRRHFEFVANLIGEIADDESRRSVLDDNCARFAAAFPRFDEKRFRDRVDTVVINCWADNGPVFERGM